MQLFSFSKIVLLLFSHSACKSHWETDGQTLFMFWLWEWRCHCILLDLIHEDMWLLQVPRLRKLEILCMVIGGGRREAGALCCLSPLGPCLPRACPIPATPYFNINSLKWNAQKCDLSHGPSAHCMATAVFRGYANASHGWMPFWKHPCPVQKRVRSNACQKPEPDPGAPGCTLWWALVGTKLQAFRAAKGLMHSRPSKDTVSHRPSHFVMNLSPTASIFLKMQPSPQEIR